MPTYHEAYRHVLDQHTVQVSHDPTDTWVHLPIRAVMVDTNGGMVELGDYSMSPGEAWLLAQSLLILAEIAEPGHRGGRVFDPVAFEQQLELDRQQRLGNEGSAV